MTDRSAQVHLNSLNEIFQRLGETGTTQALLKLLERARA